MKWKANNAVDWGGSWRRVLPKLIVQLIMAEFQLRGWSKSGGMEDETRIGEWSRFSEAVT